MKFIETYCQYDIFAIIYCPGIRHAKLSYMYFTIALTDMLSYPDRTIAPKIRKACDALMQSGINKIFLKKQVLFQARQVYDTHALHRDYIKKFWTFLRLRAHSQKVGHL